MTDPRSLTPDELLSTTRAVRRGLDRARPDERDVLEDCLRLAQQAPSGSNAQKWDFVVVTDRAKRAAIGELWREGGERYLASADATPQPSQNARLLDSVRHLVAHIHEVPVHVIPCVKGRTDGEPGYIQAGRWASIMPAAWSFMLAARSRGLRHRVDELSSSARARGCRHPRHPLRRGDAGGAHPRRLYRRRVVQAGKPQAARHDGALGRVVTLSAAARP